MEAVAMPAVKATKNELVRELRASRNVLTEAFALALESTPKWKAIARGQSARHEYLETHFAVFADYLAEYFSTGDAAFKHLLLGESIKALYDPALEDTQAAVQAAAVWRLQREGVAAVLRGRLSAQSWSTLDAQMAEMEFTATAPGTKNQHVLLVGDCLYLDIVPFIISELLESGIKLLPDYATSKSPAVLRDQLREFSTKKFDLIFFSPFSYEFSPEYAQIGEWRRALTHDAKTEEVVRKTWDETRETIDLLADLFDCPIHVHNSAAVIRDESPAKRLVKLKATAKVRATAKRQMNQFLAQYLAQKNAESFQHLFLFDEDSMVREVGEFEAGAFFYKSPLQHPATLGRILSRGYVDAIYVNAWLPKRKVVVCDLDNTMWHGVIGEGAVTHFHERQTALKALKTKGVVLAINSKNDPANVHWRGGTLNEDDFVFSSISWDPKVQGMKRIQSALNLKVKDYVFVDDRADELELVRMTYPEILCLNATDPATWRRFALWERLLEEDLEMDRTLMYKQREERKAFIKEDVTSDQERAELFAMLELKLTISQAKAADLKRVTELINRTNQFNLEGSRTSLKEVIEWHESADHVVLLGQTSDRFGDMGTTCIAVAHCSAEEMRLLPFVLSCRVFGYGIEGAVMNQLRKLAVDRHLKRVVGKYVATPQNSPCKNFLQENGFVQMGDRWQLNLDSPTPNNLAWLTITVE